MSESEFFIGWLAMPVSYRRFLGAATAMVMLLVAALALALPVWQQSPGSGAWETDSVVTIEGVAQAEPYALLRVPAGENGSAIRTFLLVEEGKFGAQQRALPLAGQYVRATGTILHREGRQMLELSAAKDALVHVQAPASTDAERLAFPARRQQMPVTLRGELIDPKCYLGAMRPGGGKTHKACAMLCISGGIPPMLVTRDQAGRETYYLLMTPDGKSAQDILLNYVGNLVEIQGTLETWDDLFILRVGPVGIRRL